MNNRIKQKNKKVYRNLKISKFLSRDEIISVIENSRFKYKEGTYRVLGLFLYRAAYGYNMRISQKEIANIVGLQRSYVSEKIIMDLRTLGLIFLTYDTEERNGYYCHQPSTYTISPLLRNASPYFQSKLCYLYPFLAKVSFTFFNALGNIREAVANKLKEIKSTLYIKREDINKNYNESTQEIILKKGDNYIHFTTDAPPNYDTTQKAGNIAQNLLASIAQRAGRTIS